MSGLRIPITVLRGVSACAVWRRGLMAAAALVGAGWCRVRMGAAALARGCSVLMAAAALAMVGCCPGRHLASSQRDSVRVVTAVSTVERFVPDTVWIEIPAQTARERVRDTVSRLENDFARSEARIYADGTLGHILCAKAGRRPAPVLRRDVMTVRTDTVCINRVRRDVVEVARPLTWWQRLQMRGFWLLLALVAGWGWLRLR